MKSSQFPESPVLAAVALLFLSVNTEARPLASSASIGGTFSFEMHQDTMADRYYSDVFGPIPLSGAPADTCTIPLSGNYAAGTPVASPVVPFIIKYVYHLELLDAAQNVNVIVANNSGASFGTVAITAGTLGTSTITNLMPNASGTALFDARAKVIDSVINVSIAVTPSTTGAFAAGNNLRVIFSLNGLIATKVVILDSLLAGYQRWFTNEYNITDTLNVDYLDINSGFFNYTVTNYTGLELQLSIAHRNLWLSSFCSGRQPPLKSVGDLVGLTRTDSVNAYDGDVALRVDFPAGQVSKLNKTNISGNRLFPEWNSATKKSVTKVDYSLNVGVYGRRVTLSAGDSLSFVFKCTSFKYKEMSGTVMDIYHLPGFSLTFAVSPSWTAGSGPNLFDYFMAVNMPAGAVLDTLGAAQKIFGTKNPAVSCQWLANIAHAVNNATVNEQTDITQVLGSKPDSMCFTEENTIPAGTHVVLVNDLTDATDPSYPKYIGRMTIRDSFAFAPSTIVEYNPVAPRLFACETVYPVLRYSLPQQCRVSADFYDMKGRLVYSYVNKSQGPGSYALRISTAPWPHGMYCMVFKAGSFGKREKVAVVR
jgi:hypothetical protein